MKVAMVKSCMHAVRGWGLAAILLGVPGFASAGIFSVTFTGQVDAFLADNPFGVDGATAVFGSVRLDDTEFAGSTDTIDVLVADNPDGRLDLTIGTLSFTDADDFFGGATVTIEAGALVAIDLIVSFEQPGISDSLTFDVLDDVFVLADIPAEIIYFGGALDLPVTATEAPTQFLLLVGVGLLLAGRSRRPAS